jgi:hypothetical protein
MQGWLDCPTPYEFLWVKQIIRGSWFVPWDVRGFRIVRCFDTNGWNKCFVNAVLQCPRDCIGWMK